MLKPYLQLVRLPNLFTAPVDSLAGWYLATGGTDPVQGAGLALASVAFYLAGIVLNDLADLPVDREERPNRPLPSGAVRRNIAIVLVGLGFLAGLLLAGAAGSYPGLLASVFLACLIFLYNIGLKKTWLGPLNMGLCRGVNVLLGASVGLDYGYPWAWGLALFITIFVVGITLISRAEARGGTRVLPGLGVSAQIIAFAGLLVMARLLAFASDIGSELTLLLGLTLLLATAVRILRAGLHGIRRPSPENLQRAVMSGVLGLPWIHAGIVVSAGAWELALILMGLSIAAGFTARRLYVT